MTESEEKRLEEIQEDNKFLRTVDQHDLQIQSNTYFLISLIDGERGKTSKLRKALEEITQTFIEKVGRIDVEDWAGLVERLQDIATEALEETK